MTQDLEKMSFIYRLLKLYSGNYLELSVVTCRIFVGLLGLERLSFTHTCEVHSSSLASKLLGYSGRLARGDICSDMY